MFLYILFIYLTLCLCEKKITSKVYLERVNPISVGLQFALEVGSSEDLLVEVTPNACCLVLDDGVDCDVMRVVGGCYHVIPKGTKKTMKLIAPLIDPYDRNGHCSFYLDSRPTDRSRANTRDVIKINFDTRLTNKKQTMLIPNDVKPCQGFDEDPFNDCSPVNCDSYYSGKKSYFDKRRKRCTTVPSCVTDSDGDMIVYNPETNKCVKEETISKDDIEFIKSLRENERRAKDVLIIKNSRPTTEVYNVTAYDSSFYPETKKLHVTPVEKAMAKCKKLTKENLMKYLMNNKYTLIVLCLIVLMQCGLICMMVYCLTKCGCCSNKKVVSTYFNYRQDASVTTPLIYTSNIDTETTEANFTSDSSNIDKKIKCYKACQKDHAKYSLSDDILTKCLNRRKWDRVPKSDTIPEYNETKIGEYGKVNFEDETIGTKVRDTTIREAVVRERKLRDKDAKVRDNTHEVQCDLSEKEIKCHIYNFRSTGKTNVFDQKKDASNSTEKGAQAQFSNDSIDDFLSERGVIFLADENIFESSSVTKSSISSKTSKNNVLKNVISLLSRRSRPCSIPRRQRSKEGLDLELIHMSCASEFTSSNGSKDMKKKDSRTSL
ncbi:hypothetical protein O3G_MSEX003105 [Manduca sexta]|uniref:Uncharacterized protein n=1 Tax=Manduca sexta TaxID=7130 RepID=A0A921YSR2_MANSE|nr:hypothetical protein O3G_MSEX003105 [Manduca sexta]